MKDYYNKHIDGMNDAIGADMGSGGEWVLEGCCCT